MYLQIFIDLLLEFIEPRSAPLILYFVVRMAEVDVHQLSQDHRHWSLRWPRDLLQKQRNDWPLDGVGQTHFSPAIILKSILYVSNTQDRDRMQIIHTERMGREWTNIWSCLIRVICDFILVFCSHTLYLAPILRYSTSWILVCDLDSSGSLKVNYILAYLDRI